MLDSFPRTAGLDADVLAASGVVSRQAEYDSAVHAGGAKQACRNLLDIMN